MTERPPERVVYVNAKDGERLARRLRAAWAGEDVSVRIADESQPAPGVAEVPVPLLLDLPLTLRRFRKRLVCVERLTVPDPAADELRARAALARVGLGDHEAMGTVFDAWFERSYSYVRTLLADPRQAGSVTVDAFLRLYHGAPATRRRFRLSLVEALHGAAGAAGLATEAPEPARTGVRTAGADSRRRAELVSDIDLAVLVDRLPLAARRALLLRFVLGLEDEEVGEALDMPADDVAALVLDGLVELRARLDGFGRCTADDRSRVAMRSFGWGSPVVRSRHRALRAVPQL